MSNNETCTHKWNIDSHNVGTCSKCGEVRQFPYEKGGEVIVLKKGKPLTKPTRTRSHIGVNPYTRHVYYEKHRQAIIADLLAIGRIATGQKWGIPLGGTIYALEKRWLTPEQITVVDRATIESPSRIACSGKSENDRLPHFPEFSMTWEPPVQLKWLEIYEKLINSHPFENS